MKNGKETAKLYLSYGLNPVPVHSESKEPARKDHSSTKFTEQEIDTYDFKHLDIGVSTGSISGGLEAIDFDLKNAEDPDVVMKVFKSKVPADLLKRLVVQQTISGGFHMIYRCEDIQSSRKLAKSAEGKAVIETRGQGGYIKCFPSEGYTLIQGSFENIPIITPEERLQLFVSAKMLNRTIVKDARKRATSEDNQYLKKFPEYNNDPEIGLDLLEKHGWTIKTEDSDWYNLTRPNSSSGDIHAGYHKFGKFLFVFSTAQDIFEEERPYNNHAIFAELECEGRYDVAYAKLYKEGHGVDEVEEEDEDDFSFISTGEDEDEYLEQARKDEIPLGAVTGWRDLDKFMRWKPNSFNFLLGLDNIGKSTLLSSFMAATKVLHGMKWGISSPESSTIVTRRNLIEAEAGKPIKYLKSKDAEYKQLLDNCRKHFIIIKNEKHDTIEEVLKKGEKLFYKYGIDVLLIDPFSFYSGSGNFSDDTEVLSKIRVFSQNFCSVLVVDHPYTGFTRNAKDANGYIQMPTKYDASGGNSKANRCDDFWSAHRIINHPDKEIKSTMQISVQKVKDKSTGGEPHNDGEWSELIWEVRNGFLGYWDSNGDNPMHKALVSKMGVRAQIKNGGMPLGTPEEAF